MRSDTVTKGMQQAPHRSLFNALGTDGRRDEQTTGRHCHVLIMKSCRGI